VLHEVVDCLDVVHPEELHHSPELVLMDPLQTVEILLRPKVD
jgi:hypothetical protein